MALRAYQRLDPRAYERKVIEQSYPLGAFAAFIGAINAAESQPDRGWFRSEKLVRALLGPAGKWVSYLIDHGDLVRCDGRLYVEGWQEWQEGDWKVTERVARINSRNGAVPQPTSGARRTANWRLRNRVFERDSFTCRYCGRADYERSWLVLEHVDPKGAADEDNLVTACRPCNKLKGGRTPEEAGMTLLPVPAVTSDASQPPVGDASRDASRDTVSPSDGGRQTAAVSAKRDSLLVGTSGSGSGSGGGGDKSLRPRERPAPPAEHSWPERAAAARSGEQR